MMVPRAFLFSSVSSPMKGTRGEKTAGRSLGVRDIEGLELPFDSDISPSAIPSNPVVIPPKRGPRMTSVHSQTANKGPRTPRKPRTLTPQSSSGTLSDRLVPSSIASILEATAIPARRRGVSGRDSRRLPRGNHVQDFSKLLLDGVGDNLMDSTGNTALDLLLSPPEDTERSTAGSDCDSEAPSFSASSISIASTPSLERDLESPPSLPTPATPSSQRSPLDRGRFLRSSPCENCAFDHPLLETEDCESEDELDMQEFLAVTVPAPSTPTPSRSFPRLGATFKSNLTASLRAIKSAAQSVSTFATPSVQPDDFLTRSMFTITPEMTDDRRPPPMCEPPSPALRRYLNPIPTVSPAEMYAYQDYPHDETADCPVSVQMQTYRRSTGKRRGGGGHQQRAVKHSQRQPFLVPVDPEIPPMPRQREPRENSDFLRMVVLEMNMRRSGKLRDDIPTRARIWLPARKGTQPARMIRYDYYEDEEEDENAVPARWVGISVESM
ncbi:uncharacterized protein BO97DRAFT_16366 [Aspergillus homomorphus CBS 101889]|uniref:Uncharacterized protein n=1 Tax=Aspergillus homomorphus (strain CBS 101889) TaxID=1450537 RepID=A0A395I2P4_ASPHC|nr:hypothetical protein BO97DRAFT_16366 [Aspergillus homomorphus CBS 101889]RAL13976.1 hypothetical protein BO97DRAFT_16366 [Aspergillus homomorphus CBS 101889]